MQLKWCKNFFGKLRWEGDYTPLRTGPNVGDSKACDGCKSPYRWYGSNTAAVWVYSAFWVFEWIYCYDCAKKIFPYDYQRIMDEEE
jgi:hypothetical protein